jgi:hypothetical protein
MSTYEDAAALLALISEFFITNLPDHNGSPIGSIMACRSSGGRQHTKEDHKGSPVTLTELLVFPIKSCPPYYPPNGIWPVSQNGLLHDREWVRS